MHFFIRLFTLLGTLAFCSNIFATPRVGIIIDDLGRDFTIAQEILALPIPVTISVLPKRSNSRQIAHAAQQQRREIMLHQPMQARGANPLGAGGINQHHSADDIATIIAENIASVPYATGFNNHMGSLLTGNPDAMQHVVDALRQHGDFYFIDSRTHKTTQAEQVARNNGLRTSRRNVFLDNVRTEQHIRQQLAKTLQVAQQQGSAIAIGHPHPITVKVIRKVLAEWQQQDVQLLPVSEIIAYQTQGEAWPKSLSHSPKVAKNLKP